jgi:pimeloyl-ACP methyl ester carboxylesterase
VVHVDVSDVAPLGCTELALEVIAPPGKPTAVLFCFPGGGMSRRYFDLAAPGYSFAQYATGRGFLVVLVDHPGIGDSDAPDDGWTLTPKVIASIEAAAVDRLLARLQAADVEGMRPLGPETPVIGVGHSMGASLLIHQQALRRQALRRQALRRQALRRQALRRQALRATYAGIVLLGWAGQGLPQYLDEQDRRLGELDETDPEAFASALVESAKKRFNGDPFPVLRRGSSQLLIANPLPADVQQALVAARAPLLAVPGHASLIPGNTRRSAAAIDVPVFLGVGENDIAINHRLIPNEFPASDDITLFVLKGAGHNQNVEPGRHELWERVTSWADQLASRRNDKTWVSSTA